MYTSPRSPTHRISVPSVPRARNVGSLDPRIKPHPSLWFGPPSEMSDLSNGGGSVHPARSRDHGESSVPNVHFRTTRSRNAR